MSFLSSVVQSFARRVTLYWIIAAFLVLVAMRLLAIFVIPPVFDEVIQIYITDDIARLAKFPVYFYQQQYMGPLESYILAPFLRLFGFSFLGARFYNEIFYLSFLGMYLWVVRRLFDHEVMIYLFFLLSFLPFPALYFTTIVGYGEIMPLAILALILLLKVSYETPVAFWYSFFLGLVSGLAFWCNPIFVVWLPALVLGLLWVVPGNRKKKAWWFFSVGFLVGLFPVWIYGFRTGIWLSLVKAGGGIGKVQDIPLVFYLFFRRMRYFLSTFFFDQEPSLVNTLIRYLSLIPFAFFAISFGKVFFSFTRSLQRSTAPEKIFHIFIIVPPLFLAVFYSIQNLIADEGMRFFLPLLIPYAFTVAWWIRWFRSVFWRTIVLGSLTGILLITSLVSIKTQLLQYSELRSILQFLEKNQLRYGIADMKIAYGLNVLSRNEIVASPVPYLSRYDPILSRVREKGASFFIVDRSDPELRKLRIELNANPKLKKVSFNGFYRYDIFYGSSKLLEKIVETEGTVFE